MLIIKRFLIFGLPLLVVLAGGLMFANSGWYYYNFGGLMFFTLFGVWYLIGRKTNWPDFVNFLFSPILLLASGWLIITFFELAVFKITLIVILAFFTFIFYNKIFEEFYKKQIWQLASFRHWLFYFQIFSIWFLSSAIYGLIIFINFSPYLALALLTVSLLIFFEQFNWFQETARQDRSGLVYLIFAAVFLESLIVINLLPLSFYFKGLIVVISYYLFTQGFDAVKSQNSGKNKWLLLNLLMGMAVIIIILLNYFNLF